MKKIDMKNPEWMEILLDSAIEEVKAISEADFLIDTDERPKYEGKIAFEISNIRFPLRITEPTNREPDAVLGFPGLFSYIKGYEADIPEKYLFSDEYGERGIRYKAVITFKAVQDFGYNPLSQPYQCAEVSIDIVEK